MQDFLAGAMASYFSRGGEHSQKFGAQLVLCAISEVQFQEAPASGVVEVGHLMWIVAAHGASRFSSKVSMSACAVRLRARAISERLSKGPR